MTQTSKRNQNNKKQNQNKNRNRNQNSKRQNQKQGNKQNKQNNKNNNNKKNKRNSRKQKGSGLMTDLAVPTALVAAREILAPMIKRRMKNKTRKSKKLRGGFIRHHSTMPAQKDLLPSIMTVDEKIKQSMD